MFIGSSITKIPSGFFRIGKRRVESNYTSIFQVSETLIRFDSAFYRMGVEQINILDQLFLTTFVRDVQGIRFRIEALDSEIFIFISEFMNYESVFVFEIKAPIKSFYKVDLNHSLFILGATCWNI
jgi:hypothetical protein